MWKTGFMIGVVAWLLHRLAFPNNDEAISFRTGSLEPKPPRPASLTDAEKADFHRDGFVLKRGIVAPGSDELAELVTAGEMVYASHNMLDLIFRKSFAKLAMQVWRQNGAFLRLAFESSFPSITAELMGEQTKSIRILKDSVFGFKAVGNTGCGFHVDDRGFWPADDASTGVNFWLALSPIRIAQGGGIRVVNQSLTTAFAQECQDVIRGENGGYNLTCIMEELSPSCHERLLAASVVYDMEPGDALIWDRWTFHRSEPFVVETNEHKLRYTIRYVPGSARAHGMVHESVAQGELLNGPFYPQVWPKALPEEVSVITKGIGSDLEISLAKLLKLLAKTIGLS